MCGSNHDLPAPAQTSVDGMRVLVTGAAGFVGSHLVGELLDAGHEVVAVDCLLPESYSADVKRSNLATVVNRPGVRFVEADLRTDDLAPILVGCDAVINEAAMPGLAKSWDDFHLYASCNLLAVDRLIRASREAGIGRFVQISTSSVYGQYAVGDESSPTEPFSPYGVSKLAAEKLVLAHVANFGFPAVVLRYFSLYGPRQRPDMGYHLFCEAMLDGRPVTVFGDGHQTRSNTHVRDAVAATIAALNAGEPGSVINIAGGQSIDLLGALRILGDELGVEPDLAFESPRPGDQRDTFGDTTLAKTILGWSPLVDIESGLREQARWHRAQRG